MWVASVSGGFTKLFGSILDSTVWLETNEVRIVWITMLAMANRDGVIEASVPGLAKRANVGREHVERAIEVFSAPDPDSRSREHDGRRIETIDGGWRLLNHEKYRRRASIEDARDQAAERKRRQRDRQRTPRDVGGQVTAVTPTRDMSRSVTAVTRCHDIAEADTEAERESARADVGLSTDLRRWAAWLRWRDDAKKNPDPPAFQADLEAAWSAVEREIAAKLSLPPDVAFRDVCRAYLAWPDGKPLPGGKTPPRGDRPASWLRTGVYQIAEHLATSSSSATVREEAARRAAALRAVQPTDGQARRA